MSKELLIDSMPIRLSVEESESGKMIARGEFARCDVPTQNGRSYPRAIFEREVQRLSESIERRRAFGELDHPSDGKTKLTRASHIITKLTIDDDGHVLGEAEILDTPNGRTLKAILAAGAEVGVSSRGFGSVKPGVKGGSVVGEDFVLRSFDFVADPAMKTAYPQIFAEDVDYLEDFVFTAETLQTEFPELVSELTESILSDASEKAKEEAEIAVKAAIEIHTGSVRAEMVERFERQLAETVIAARDEITASIREEYENDPANAGAAGLLQKIASMVEDFGGSVDESAEKDQKKARDLEISSLKVALEQTETVAKDAGYRLYVERQIGGHPMAETIRSVMGDVAKCDTLEDVKARLAQVLADLDGVVTKKAEEDERVAADAEASHVAEISLMKEGNNAMSAKVKALESKLVRAVEIGEKLQAEADEAMGVAEDARLESYKAKAVVGLSNANSLYALLEDVDDTDAIDRLVSAQGSHRMSSGALEEARAKLKRGASSEQQDRLEESNVGVHPASSVMNGMSMDHFRSLAGI